MPADFSYIPVAPEPGPDPRLANVQISPAIDRTPIQPIQVNDVLSNYYGVRQAQRQDVAAADADRLRKATIQAAGPGATEFDIADLEEYRARFGSLPTDPVTGQVNQQEVRTRLTNQKQLEAALALQQGGAAGMKFEDQMKLQEKQRQLNDALQSGESMLNMIKSGERNVVGPGTGRLGWAYQLGTALGIPGAKDYMTDQRVLEQEISKDILRSAENMKGQLSDRDVAFLKASVPKLTDPEDVWVRYLDLRNSLIRQAQAGIASGTSQMGNQVSDQQIQTTLTERGLTEDQINQVLQGVDIVPTSPTAGPGAAPQAGTGIKKVGGQFMVLDPATGQLRPASNQELAANTPRFSNPSQTAAPATPPNPYANLRSVYGYKKPLLQITRPGLQGVPVTTPSSTQQNLPLSNLRFGN